MKTPNQLPGCIVWLARDGEEVTNELQNGHSVFIWTDPNDPRRGQLIVLDHDATEEERAAIMEFLAVRYQPALG
jgi:hypothetical protein